MRYIKKYTMREWDNFDNDIVVGVCQKCDFETGDGDKMYEHFDKTEHIFEWEFRNIQEIMCKKYNIILTDFQTKEEIKNEKKRKSKERKIQMLKKTGHIMGEIGVGTLQVIQMFSARPAPKKKRKRRR